MEVAHKLWFYLVFNRGLNGGVPRFAVADFRIELSVNSGNSVFDVPHISCEIGVIPAAIGRSADRVHGNTVSKLLIVTQREHTIVIICCHIRVAVRVMQGKLFACIRNESTTCYLRMAAAGYLNIVAGDVNIPRLINCQVPAAGQRVCDCLGYHLRERANSGSKCFHGLNYPIEVQVVQVCPREFSPVKSHWLIPPLINCKAKHRFKVLGDF